jgi:hypothetical protein
VSDTTVSAVLAAGCRSHTTVSAVLVVYKQTANTPPPLCPLFSDGNGTPGREITIIADVTFITSALELVCMAVKRGSFDGDFRRKNG